MNRVIIFIFFIFTTITGVNGQEQGTLFGTIKNHHGVFLDDVLVKCDKLNVQTESDKNGNYMLSLPANQELKIRFSIDQSIVDTIITLKFFPGEVRELHLILRHNMRQLGTTVITTEARDNNVLIDHKIFTQLPSPSGNIESLLKTFSGVYSTNEMSYQYNVRGGNFDENLVYVNDIEIYRPFLVRSAQQEGLSFINPDLAKSVKFSAGGFEAKYGDKMSSVMDVEYKTPALGFRSSASASLLGASVHTEGNIANKFTYLVGIRYKSNSYLLNSLETKGDYKPRFFDAQMLLNWNINSKWSVNLLGNISKNTYIFTPSSRKTNFGSWSNLKQLVIDYSGQEVDRYSNYLGAFAFHFKPSLKNRYKLTISSYHATESETYDIEARYLLSDIEPDLGSESNDIESIIGTSGMGAFLEHARNELSSTVSAADLRGYHKVGKHNIDWGVKFQHEYIKDRIKEWKMLDSSGYSLPNQPSGTPGDSVPLGDPSRELLVNPDNYINAANTLNTIRFSGFIQDSWRIGGAEHFTLNYGVRYSFWSYNKEFLLSPRVQLTYDPKWENNKWLFHLRGGCYHQSPFYREMRDKYGELNPNIKAQRSYQVVGVAEYAFEMWKRPFKLSAEAYYKYLDNLVSYTIDNMKIVYSGKNDAVGYATGIDLRLSGEFVHGLESWISLSIMKTEEDIQGDYIQNEDGSVEEVGYLPRPTDQRFSINIFFQDHIPRVENFRVHLNFVFASGTPYSISGKNRASGLYENRNGKIVYSRTSWYRRVDIGFSYRLLANDRDRNKNKSNFIKKIDDFSIYLEIFNLLGTNNVSSYTWVTDIYNQKIKVPNYLTQRLINLKFAIAF